MMQGIYSFGVFTIGAGVGTTFAHNAEIHHLQTDCTARYCEITYAVTSFVQTTVMAGSVFWFTLPLMLYVNSTAWDLYDWKTARGTPPSRPPGRLASPDEKGDGIFQVLVIYSCFLRIAASARHTAGADE